MSQEPYHKPLLGEIHPVRKLHLGKACHHSNQLIDKTKSIPSLKVQIRLMVTHYPTNSIPFMAAKKGKNKFTCML